MILTLHEEYGFVLKRLTETSPVTLSLVTAIHGKIRLSISEEKTKKHLSPGMLLLLSSHQSKKSQRKIQEYYTLLDYINVPTEKNLLWLHQLCEIGYYFIPAEEPCSSYFILFESYYLFWQQAYADQSLQKLIISLSEQKKIQLLFILRLLFLCGWHVPSELERLYYFHKILEQKNQISEHEWLQEITFFAQKISSEEEDKIERWLSINMQQHPCYSFFKTIH